MKVMTLRVPDEVQKILMTYVKKHGLTRNALVLQILWRWLDGMKRKGDESGKEQ